MALIVLFAIRLLIITVNYSEALKDYNYKSNKNATSLYNATDQIVILTTHDFHEKVYNASTAWLVEFYASWCGDCQKFSYVLKPLAASVYNWQDVVKVGVVQCNVEINEAICREHDVQSVPSLLYFPPKLNKISFSNKLTISDPKDFFNYQLWRAEIIKRLENTWYAGDWPHFSPVSADGFDPAKEINKKDLLILIVEEPASFVGREILLDLYSVKKLTARYSFDKKLSKNGEKLPQVFVFKPDKSKEQLPLTNTTRFGVFTSLQKYLRGKEYNLPDIIESDPNQLGPAKINRTEKQSCLINKVFMDDLESSVRYTLFQEVPLQNITGEKMRALRTYLNFLKKYFPDNRKVHSIVDVAIDGIKDTTFMIGDDFKNLLIEQSKKLNLASLKDENWVNCKGTSDQWRGYTCSLWLLFHYASFQAYTNKIKSDGSMEILNAVKGYIGNFFYCGTCRKHFSKMTKTIAGNVTTVRDSVVWLWKAHNVVNKRLSTDWWGDPAFPKEQFPIKSKCPNCRRKDGSWDKKQVLTYLEKMYTNVYSNNDVCNTK